MQCLCFKNQSNIKESITGVVDISVRILIVVLGIILGLGIIGLIPWALCLIYMKAVAVCPFFAKILYWIMVSVIFSIPQIFFTIYGFFCMALGLKIATEL